MGVVLNGEMILVFCLGFVKKYKMFQCNYLCTHYRVEKNRSLNYLNYLNEKYKLTNLFT